MNILHVISTCNPISGGPIEGVKLLYSYYKKRGINVNILCSDNKKAKWLKDKRLPKVFATGPKLFSYGYNPKMLIWLRENIKQYDLIIIEGIWEYHNYAVWKVAKKSNVPYYVYLHGMLDPWFKKKYPFKHIKKYIYWKLLQYKILKNSKSILYTCDEERILAKKSFTPFNCREKVIGYGIAGDLNKKSRKQNLFTKKFPETKNKRIILFFGRIHEKKGIDILIKCFIKIFALNSKFHLVIVGPYTDKIFNKLNNLVVNSNIRKSITWTGPLYEALKWDAYNAAEIFCLPSHQENFGISVAEAMSCKKPVIITNKVNIWKTIKNYSAGIITNDNVNSFYYGLKTYIKLDKKKYKKLCNNAYTCYINNFHINQVANNLIKYLKKSNNIN